jgi:nitrogenase molybdenum-cofactor synthesis protein NifE
MPWLDINQERHQGYMGYFGMVNLVKEIDRTLSNPVWQAVRKPAPWAKAGDSWQEKALAQIAAEQAELAVDPLKAEEVRRAKPVCMCKGVTLGAIEDAIRDGATTPDAVKEKTSASGGCGACAIRIQEILDQGAIVGQPTQTINVAAE